MKFTPIARITLGLVLLTTGLLLAGNLLGLTPDSSRETLNARQRFCETLAIQSSLALRDNNIALIRSTIEAVVERDPEILSAALRTVDGTLVAQTPLHHQHWQAVSGNASTITHVQVPIYRNSDRWGSAEISFRPLRETGPAGLLARPFIQLLLFVALSGCIVYYLMIGRVLKHLDPSSVIPARVKAALDVLAEGVVLVDKSCNIVMANAAFASKVGISAKSLIGMDLSSLPWQHPGTGKSLHRFPWQTSIRTRKNQTGTPMSLTTNSSGLRSLMVNSAPILDGKGKSRGALITFDDLTQLEEKNSQLEAMLSQLKSSQEEIQQKNEELKILASLDPLTVCLNRRALFKAIDEEIAAARLSGTPLSCVMCDIDHFKQINDSHGHIIGDQVIRQAADVLKSLTRSSDAVGRYGGEEFCILLPGMAVENAAAIAERFRAGISAIDFNGISITASFGVAELNRGEDTTQKLLQHADIALYRAKKGGRNRVVTGTSQQVA